MLLCLHYFTNINLLYYSDARPPGMRTVAGSILTSGNILSWRLVMKSFLWPFSPFSLYCITTTCSIHCTAWRRLMDSSEFSCLLNNTFENKSGTLTDQIEHTPLTRVGVWCRGSSSLCSPWFSVSVQYFQPWTHQGLMWPHHKTTMAGLSKPAICKRYQGTCGKIPTQIS